MGHDIVHFAIHADDCQRAKRFYEGVFDWVFEPWGPPEFWLIHTSVGGILGALQPRQTPVTGRGMIGFHCTVSVDDLASMQSKIEAHGGRITMPPTVLEAVGTLLELEDPEGNVLSAMQYEPGVMDNLQRPGGVQP